MKKRVLAIFLSALIGMQGIVPVIAEEIAYEDEILIEDSGELLDEEPEMMEESEEEEFTEDFFLDESEEEFSEGELFEETVEPEEDDIVIEDVEFVESEPAEEPVIVEEPIVETDEELGSGDIEQVGEVMDSGTFGDNLSWTLTDDGMLTISGTGDMPDLFNLPPWVLYGPSIKKAVINSGVTSIGDSAFYYCNNLTSVTIGNSVTSIGNSAFYGCSNLTNVTIGNSVTSIGNSAFYGCSNLASMTIPDSVTSIGGGAFQLCGSLTDITIPDGVKSIGDLAFANCSNLTNVMLPDSVRSIGSMAFDLCTKLKSVAIPDGVVSIEDGTFTWCSGLTNVTIPKSVVNIGRSSFNMCDSLTDVYYAGSEEEWKSIDIGSYNDPLLNATIHFNSTGPSFYVFGDDGNKCFPLEGVKAYYYGKGPYLSDEYGEIIISKTEETDELSGDEEDALTSESYSEYGLVLEKDGYRTKKYKEFSTPDDDAYTIYMTPLVTQYNGEYAFLSNDATYDTVTECSYSDDYFNTVNTENSIYNSELARISIALALSAFSSSKHKGLKNHVNSEDYFYYYNDKIPGVKAIEDTPACNVADLMYNCGFDDISINEDYILDTAYNPGIDDGHNMGVCIGNKELSDGSTLIAIALRGAGYGCEWIGNFTVMGSTKYHIGFYRASQKVLLHLYHYIKNYNLSGKKVKVWITGYSRAGAVANLTAAYLCDNGVAGCDCDSSYVYAYTFEAPQGTKAEDYHAQRYSGIWNIVNPIDPVPMFAMTTSWGYNRYGETKWLPSNASDNSGAYTIFKKDVLKLYKSYIGKNAIALPEFPLQRFIYLCLTDALGSDTGWDDSPLAQYLQDKLQDLFRKEGKNSTLADGTEEYVLGGLDPLTAGITHLFSLLRIYKR